MTDTIITFAVCFLPGIGLGYAACAICHNRRIARRIARRYPRRLNIERL